jgi:hypothetical protein
MAVVSINSARNAKTGAKELCTRNEAGLQTNFSVMQAVRSFCGLNRQKPLDEIRMAVGKRRASDRMIQYWLSNKYSISADDLAALLRSDAGFAILENIMGDAKPVWWLGFKRGVKRAELRRQQKLIQKALDEDEQGELNI